eukprot:1255528-Prymnesium_polylepis.2
MAHALPNLAHALPTMAHALPNMAHGSARRGPTRPRPCVWSGCPPSPWPGCRRGPAASRGARAARRPPAEDARVAAGLSVRQPDV